MNYRMLGNTPLKVSEICYGTMTFGAYTDVKESEEIFNKALELGINFFDTAEVYGGKFGYSEEILGKIMKDKRKDIILSTKVHGFMEPNRYQSRKEIIETLEQSLKRLKTDYIDVYFLHWNDPYVSIEERLNTLDKLVKDGKIRYIGTSNFDSWLVYKMLKYSRDFNLQPISVMQEIFNPVDFDVKKEIISLAKEEKLGIMVYSPLASGFLTGKYKKGEKPPAGSRGDIKMDWEKKRWEFRFSDYGFKILDIFENISKKYNATISQIVISYLLSFEVFSTIIIGAKDLKQLVENVKGVDIKIENSDIENIKNNSYFLY